MSNSKTQETISSSRSTKQNDPGWKHGFLQDPNQKNDVTCLFCNKTTKGGICRHKQHLVGGYKNTIKCLKCPEDVRQEIIEYMSGRKKQKEDISEPYYDYDSFGVVGDGEDEDEDDIAQEVVVGVGKRMNSMTQSSSLKIGGARKKSRPNVKGPMDLYIMNKKGKGVNLRQTSMKETCNKELRARTVQDIARFFYQAGLAFNAAHLDSFKRMIESIGAYGPHLKPPSYHELRVPLLKKELEHTNELMQCHKDEWDKIDCSIMSDGWTDKKQRTLINFLVNCSRGTMFIESVDASAFVKTGEKLYELLDGFVGRIGEKNVMQVITDNGSNYVLASKLLETKRPNLYWTPCVAHCIDLMLEDIGKIDRIKRTVARAINLVGYIYNHGGVLSMMRRFTEQKELARHWVTPLLLFFSCCKEFINKSSVLGICLLLKSGLIVDGPKKRRGKVTETIFMPSFWNTVSYTLRVIAPLVRVLRLADNEKKPAMGYIYSRR